MRHAEWFDARALLALFVLVNTGGCTTAAQNRDVPALAPSYRTEQVSFDSNGTGLSGILWLPPHPGPHPALVLVDGSGRTRADKWTPWMKRLVGLGFACLSYDKRGVGDSEGTYLGGLSIDIPLLASDVVSGVNYMKRRNEVDSSQMGLLGVSQAGWVIPVATARSPDVSFTVIFAGTTVTLGEENYYSQLTGDDPFWKYVYRNLSSNEISRRLAAKGPSMFDPWPYLQRMTVPGLWLYGELDRSQPTRESIVILEKLIKDHNKDFTYRVFEGADHSINVDGELVDGVFETMTDWISTHVTVKESRTEVPSAAPGCASSKGRSPARWRPLDGTQEHSGTVLPCHGTVHHRPACRAGRRPDHYRALLRALGTAA